MISPSPRAAVCHVGDHQEVVCTATESIVDWNVAFMGTTVYIIGDSDGG